MGPAYFVIAILGCGDGGTACTPIATLDTRYETQAQCMAATGAALIENNDFEFPHLAARCDSAATKAASHREPKAHKRRGG